MRLAACLTPVIVGESIETEQQLDATRAVDAPYGTGRMFERPMTASWTVPDDLIGTLLAAAMIANGALLSPSGASRQTLAGRKGTDHPLSRTDRVSDKMRALISRARSEEPS
ncbi:hypothetical protein EOA75_02140 [Mesorhizobium sp. M1A.F.Ca.IN.022.07.1.1]|uniref:hypothetical protein n=1 Tax=unclassified Mesorhizobium TaxID=325217 RepID=UPI000F761C1E|nr:MULTISPECIES: hypothetical protein [unclassified Mesorhizobium]TGV92920.1 hypothetical protein EN801_007245 [Mesorhizobium sp. M00.F.Ca.ET.158.01.1.1]AZO61966.1 hypothetical protein EJ078_24005 [Mesorhizobium sp. M1A.F.Ca.IN.022.06.1.1]RUV26797.1 hypothetical protein EOA91_03115 [Mesorhizobium sp. M1A.F.Ca.IN.022.04.1.1]RUV97908.1 hypothetical protein EOA75_02140 [Mesorhizobium sp. M1A.F.Ca.IN.022.07.1.1]RWG37519.1 MAG: hypothetical protein EOQ60_00065 [Mesorhizobium sp.]